MKNTVRTVPKSNRKIIESGKIDTPTHKYMIAYFPNMVQTTLKNISG